MRYSRLRWRAALTRRRHRSRRPARRAAERLVTSNVGQNYPYTSETEADRAGRDRGRSSRARRTWPATLAAETTPLDAQRALVGLEVPDEGLPGPPPRRRLRGREARRLRRLRRDLRQDLPALSEVTGPDIAAPDDRGQPPAARDRRASGSRSRPSASGSSTGWPRARPGFSPIEAMAMSVLVFAGAAQFAAVGYVASGLAWPGDHPADGAAQRPPPALLGGPGAVAARTSGQPPRRAWPTS